MGTWRPLAAGLAIICLTAACGSLPPGHPSPSPTQAVAALGGAGPCTSISLSESKGPSITAGDIVSISAHAGGCSSPLYRFLLLDQAGATGTVTRDWGTGSSWTWDSYTTPAGRYLVRADARSSGSFAGVPEVSSYLAFTVLAAVPVTVETCRLPVSGPLSGSGGFIQMPSGKFTPDPGSSVAYLGQGDPSGLRRGLTYDPVHGVWLPVPRDWVMPDFSSYAYVGTEYPRVGNQPALHVVRLPSGADKLWANGDALYGYLIALRPDGVYGAPGPEIITMVDPTGAVSTIDQGHNGLYAVITPTAIFASKVGTTGPTQTYTLTLVQRIDPRSGNATDWFTDGGLTVLPIGSDASGSPIVAAGKQLQSGAISTTAIWVVPQASTGSAPVGRLLYSNPSKPLTVIGSPIASAGGIWIETDQGLWLDDGAATMRLVSSFSGYIAGGCI